MLTILFWILTFFRLPCLNSEHKVSVFLFDLENYRKVFCILFLLTYNLCWDFWYQWKKHNFGNWFSFKNYDLPSSVRWCIRQTFETFWVLVILSSQFFSFRFSLLYKKWIPGNFYGIITQINKLHATKCHFYNFQPFNTCNVSFFIIWFHPWTLWKCCKCIKKFIKRSFVS